ncbi:MAG: hypothetical protein GY847_00675 [Proteobacteria bacterium]|nr:hypothetical protein [Pseudomonadota bacterium]
MPNLDLQIMLKTVGGMCNRQIARDLRVSPTTINRHIARLGRHCLLFHIRMMTGVDLSADIVIDGFESFEYSQYHPFHHHLAVEKDTSFFIYFTDSELRRKGRMTRQQKKRRRELEQRHGRPDPQAVRKDVAELLEYVLADLSAVVIRSDDHHAYRRSMKQVMCEIDHRVTSSKDRRDTGNELFEVNLLDLLIRHSSANHKRETIAWSKRRAQSAYRLAILLVWRNYIKRRWEKRCRHTPAMLKGLVDQILEPEDILRSRLFRTRMDLPARWGLYYDCRIETRELAVNQTHDLRYAY